LSGCHSTTASVLSLRRRELVALINDPGFLGDDRQAAASTGDVAGGDEMLECPSAASDNAAVIPPQRIALAIR